MQPEGPAKGEIIRDEGRYFRLPGPDVMLDAGIDCIQDYTPLVVGKGWVIIAASLPLIDRGFHANRWWNSAEIKGQNIFKYSLSAMMSRLSSTRSR